MDDESGLWYFDVQNKISNNVMITGIYQCIAINAFGKALSMPMRLEIARIGTFHDLNAKTILIKPNETNILNCSTTKSIPTAKIQWMVKNDEDGFMNFVHEDENHMMDDNGNLYLLNANYSTIQKNLTYTCVINNAILHTMKIGPEMKLQWTSSNLLPIVENPLNIVYHSALKQIVLLNESLSLKCIIHGNSPLPKIHWEFMSDQEALLSNINHDYQYRNVNLVKFTVFFVGVKNVVYSDFKNDLDYRDVHVLNINSEMYQLPENYGIRLKNHGMELYIPNVQMINHGSYRCSVMNMDYFAPLSSSSNSQIVFNVTVET
ncbi:unnamed protein product [Schistosoma turkestanicum]|nr:unnamed protein product [Schistosoma turkestanicum]